MYNNLTSLLPIILSMTVLVSAETMTVSGSTFPETTVSPSPQFAVIVTLPSSPDKNHFLLKDISSINQPVTGSAVNITPASLEETISWMTTHISPMIDCPCCRLNNLKLLIEYNE